MKRPLKESRLMDKAILELFDRNPDAKLVAHRYRAIRALLIEKFPEISTIEKERMCNIIFDAISFDRKIRKFTEGNEVELKQTLSEEYIAQELGLPELK